LSQEKQITSIHHNHHTKKKLSDMINTRPLSPTMTKKSVASTKGNKSAGNIISSCSLPQQGAEYSTNHRVQFSNDENDTHSAPHEQLSPEMIAATWYSYQEIQHFKEEVRSAVLRHYYQQGETKNEDDEMAGLEKYDPQRSQYKQSALHYTLQAQSQSRDPSFLRSIARRCTAWARTLAINQGFNDYCAVYDPLDGLLDVADFESRAVNADDNEQNRISEIRSTEKHRQDNETEMNPAQTKKQRIS